MIPIVLYCITTYIIFLLSKELYKNTSLAIFCSVTFFLLPSVSFSSFLVSTDTILVLLWSLALLKLLRLKEGSDYFDFIVFGIIIGLAVLAKYAAIYFLIGFVFLVFVEKEFRLFFFNNKFKFFISLLSTLIVVLPNIIWNYQNGWLTFDHTANNASLNNININLFGFFEFIFAQILMLGPLLFFSYIFYFKKTNRFSKEEIFLLSFSLPPLVIVILESILVRAHANWAAVSLVTLMIFLFANVYKINKKVIYINNCLNFFLGLVLFLMIAFSYPLSIFNRISGINDFTKFIDRKNVNKLNNIVLNDRMLFANLSYEYYSRNFNFFSTRNPNDKIGHHFQLKNALPVDFNENFLLIGNIENINYISNKYKFRLLGSDYFLFSKNKQDVYEVIFN